MAENTSEKWEFVGFVWLDEDDGDEYYVSCPCTPKERKALKKISRQSENYILQSEGKFDEQMISDKMDDVVNTNDNLAEFRVRAYMAALQGAKKYVSEMRHDDPSKIKVGKKDMLAGPDDRELRVEVHYYKMDIL
ncbi:MAG: hypothetical protein PUB39_05390 [Eubacteriales bacterium]|nr:hypothetical protein [Eubacteriales bacterium]